MINIKKLFFNLLYVALIVIVIYTCISMMIMLKSSQNDCIKNAMVYGAREQMKGQVHCDCTEVKDDRIYFFHFNDTSWWADRQLIQESVKSQELNISKINFTNIID